MASRITSYLLIVCAAFLLIFGCSKSSSEQPESKEGLAVSSENRVFTESVPGLIITNQVCSSWADLPSEASLVIIGTNHYTKADLDTQLQGFLAQMKRDIKDPYEAEKRIQDAQYSFRNSLIAKFVNETVFLLEAEEQGLTPLADDLAMAWGGVSNVCLRLGLSYEAFVTSFPGGRAALERGIYMNCVTKRLFDLHYASQLAVSEAEVDKLHADLVRLNQESEATNRIYKAEVESFRQKISVEPIEFGDDEEENARLLPEGYSVELFKSKPPSGFEDEEVIPGILRGLSTNQWSSVVELEDSFDLYYVTEIIPRTVQQPTLYTGIRISREKDHGYLVPDKAQLMKDERQRKNMDLIPAECERLSLKFGIVYPQGFVWDDKPKTQDVQAMGLKTKGGAQ